MQGIYTILLGIYARLGSIRNIGHILSGLPAGIRRLGRFEVAVFRVWQSYRDLGDTLKNSRISLIILLLLSFVLLGTSQGKEAAVSVVDYPMHAAFYTLGVFAWAFHTWFGTRLILEHLHPRAYTAPAELAHTGRGVLLQGFRQALLTILRSLRNPPRAVGGFLKNLQELEWCVSQVPRILAVATYAVAILALLFPVLRGQAQFDLARAGLLLVNLLLAIAFYVIAVRRRDFCMLLHRGIEIHTHAPYDDLRALQKIQRRANFITYVYSIVMIVAALLVPAHLGFALGTLGVMFLGFSSIVAVGNWFILHLVQTARARLEGNRNLPELTGRFPVISVLVLYAIALSFFNDNHLIRRADHPPQQFPSFEAAMQRWLQQAPQTGDGVRPMVVFATAGGGIRAAQWTAAVLTGLTDAHQDFPRSVYSISGVSGGSVGAAYYDAILREGQRACGPDRQGRCWQWTGRRTLSEDYLAPAVAGMLYPDLIQRFLPTAVLPDRQAGLEKGFEVGLRNGYDRGLATPGLRAPYTSLWAGAEPRWLPYLLLNSTHMETGKRVVASPFRLDPEVFRDTVDLIDLTQMEMRLSTAAANSARFPYVSPVGTLPCAPIEGGWLRRWWHGRTCRNGHIVDGGYFENFGAVTTLQALNGMVSAGWLREHRIRPIVVLISSDPGLVCSSDGKGRYTCQGDIELQGLRKDGTPTAIEVNGAYRHLTSSEGANEIAGPLKASFSPRDARGILAAKNLNEWVETCRAAPADCGLDAASLPGFFHFRLDLQPGEVAPALGWVLSDESEELIWRKLDCSAHNRAAKQELLQLLGVKAPPAPATECPA